MSAPRPYVTYPFHQPALSLTSMTILTLDIYIQNYSVISSIWYLHCVLGRCVSDICAFQDKEEINGTTLHNLIVIIKAKKITNSATAYA